MASFNQNETLYLFLRLICIFTELKNFMIIIKHKFINKKWTIGLKN